MCILFLGYFLLYVAFPHSDAEYVCCEVFSFLKLLVIMYILYFVNIYISIFQLVYLSVFLFSISAVLILMLTMYVAKPPEVAFCIYCCTKSLLFTLYFFLFLCHFLLFFFPCLLLPLLPFLPLVFTSFHFYLSSLPF